MSSGSSGNCQYIETKETKILIDVGLTGKETTRLLNNIGVDPSELDAIFVTHEHIDHVSGVGVMSRKYNLPIYANGETWEAMAPTIKKIAGNNIKEFRIEDNFYFKDLFVKPVPTFHDAVNPNGYVFETNQHKISLVTDTGWFSSEMQAMIAGSDLYFLESNHDVEMLKNGSYPWNLKQRILSTRGHLSNENCSDVVENLLKVGDEIIILSHLSKDNNTPDLAYTNMRKRLEKLGVDFNDGEVSIEVAPRRDVSVFYDLRREK